MSAFDPTSTPWVGSSSTSTRGVHRNQRAITTFCWLPPDSSPMMASVRAGRTSSSSTHSSACGRLRRACGADRRDQNGLRSPIVRFSRTVSMRNSASLARSAGTAHSPASIAAARVGAAGSAGRRRGPRRSARGGPTSKLASSSRPDPVSPAMPTTSPGWTSRLNGASSAPPTPRSDSTGFCALRRRRRVGCGRPPRRRADDRASGWRGPRGSARSRALVATRLPSRRTVTRSAIVSTSSR